MTKLSKTKFSFLILLMVFITSCISDYDVDDYDDQACKLIQLKMKGRITSVGISKRYLFDVDSSKEYFPFSFEFSKDSYREIYEVEKGNIVMQPKVGDSIFKQAGSRFIKFKRHGKIFVESIRPNVCH